VWNVLIHELNILEQVDGYAMHSLHWCINNLYSKMYLQSLKTYIVQLKSVIITLWNGLEIATIYGQISFSKIYPPVHEFMSPTVRQREIIQGKFVQIGNYPTDWSQNNPLGNCTGSTTAV
jgi:hypothetical protein